MGLGRMIQEVMNIQYYEILPAFASAVVQKDEEADMPSSLSPLMELEFDRWCELMVCCRELTLEEEVYLERFRETLFRAFGRGDLLEISSPVDPPVHLFSSSLSAAVARQKFTEDLYFLPMRVLRCEGDTPQLYEAVRYAPRLYVPCLKPLRVYRSMGEKECYEFLGFQFEIDWTRCGHKVYKRRGSLLVLNKEQMGEVMFFRVLNEKEAPLVVREDILEQWLAWGIEVDFQDVYVE